MGFAELRLLGLSSVVFMCLALPAQAQTLDEQYLFYLLDRCANLNFDKDASLNVLPGQAGSRLAAFCSGPPLVGGGGGTTASGGGTAIGSDAGGSEQALRRRQQAARDADSASTAGDPSDVTLFNTATVSVFLNVDYQWEKQTATRFEAGRRWHQTGTTLGIDRRLGTQGLAGLALNYGRKSGNFSDVGGDFSADRYGAVLYGSWFPNDRTFVDVNVGLARQDTDTQRIVFLRREVFGNPLFPPNIVLDPPPSAVDSEAKALESQVQLRGGYDWNLGRATFGLRAAALAKHASFDDYTEHGDTPMTLVFEDRSETSVRSSLGIDLRAAFTAQRTVLQPQFSADWLHEFRDDQHLITAHFAEDLRPNPARLRFRNDPPDRDFALVRVSLASIFTSGVSAFVALEGLLGHATLDHYVATLGVRLEL